MIGQIIGKLSIIDESPLMISSGNIGYEIFLLKKDIDISSTIENKNKDLTFWTHLIFKEDNISLFGFLNKIDRIWFKRLIKISSVGPKLGLAILDNLNIDEIIYTVQTNCVNTLSKVPGIGKKLAAKIILELESFVKEWQLSHHNTADKNNNHNNYNIVNMENFKACLQVLIKLGYKEAKASSIIRDIQKKYKVINLSELIRLVLQTMDK